MLLYYTIHFQQLDSFEYSSLSLMFILHFIININLFLHFHIKKFTQISS